MSKDNNVNTIVITKPREPIADLDKLPFPKRSLINMDKYIQYPNAAGVTHCITMQATRGCPYGCVFCHKVFSKNHYFRSAENIFEELKIYYNIGFRRVRIR